MKKLLIIGILCSALDVSQLGAAAAPIEGPARARYQPEEEEDKELQDAIAQSLALAVESEKAEQAREAELKSALGESEHEYQLHVVAGNILPADFNNKLLETINSNDPEILRALIAPYKAVFDVNNALFGKVGTIRNAIAAEPLDFAIQLGKEKIVKALLEDFKDVIKMNAPNRFGRTHLGEALVVHKSRPLRLDILRLLLEAGADANIVLNDYTRELPLMRATRETSGEFVYTAIPLLIAAGADIYVKDNDGKTIVQRIMKDRPWDSLNMNEKNALLVIKQKDDEHRAVEAQRQASLLAALHEQSLPATADLGGIMQQYAREYEPGRLEFPKEMNAAQPSLKKK